MTTTLTAEDAELMSFRIFLWLNTLDQRSAERNSIIPTTFTCDEPRKGQRYVRVVARHNGKDAYVHAFYDQRTGDVYKAAGWKAPAKHVRFNLLDDESFTRMIEVCDPYGSYLYIR